MIPNPKVAVDPPLQFFTRGPDGQLVDLAVEVAKDWTPRRIREANATFRRNLIRLEAHLAGRARLHVVASRPASRSTSRAPRKAARRSTSSSSSSTSDDGGEPPPPPLPAELRRLKQVAEHLHAPKSTVHSWVTSGLLSHYKINGIILVDLADLARFLARHRVEGRP